MTGVESKIEGLIQILNESDGRILEVCRSGKMTMRRGQHTSRVLRAMETGDADPPASEDEALEAVEEGAAIEPE
jgi:acetolactate synthase-1/3 small subunit